MKKKISFEMIESKVSHDRKASLKENIKNGCICTTATNSELFYSIIFNQ